MISDRLVSVVFYVSQVFLEAGVEGASFFRTLAVNSVSDFCVCVFFFFWGVLDS